VVRPAGCCSEVSFTISNEMKNEDQCDRCPLSQCQKILVEGWAFLSLFLSSPRLTISVSSYYTTMPSLLHLRASQK
jgi:hypothetical protein